MLPVAHKIFIILYGFDSVNSIQWLAHPHYGVPKPKLSNYKRTRLKCGKILLDWGTSSTLPFGISSSRITPAIPYAFTRIIITCATIWRCCKRGRFGDGWRTPPPPSAGPGGGQNEWKEDFENSVIIRPTKT